MSTALNLSLLGLILWVQIAWSQSAARQAGYLYLSPLPRASYVSAQTRYVLVRLESGDPSQIANLATDFITVMGANSGPHSGTTRVASDGKTIIFEIATDFNGNELVTVDLDPQFKPGTPTSAGPFEYQFMTTTPMTGSLPLAVGSALPPPALPGDAPSRTRSARTQASLRIGRKAKVTSNGVSVPSDFPNVTISVNSNASPGYLFLENSSAGVAPYLMMLDNSGCPVWYRQGPLHNFVVQKNGMITWTTQDGAGFTASDENFNYLKTYLTTNGYLTDSHELKVLPDGSYFMIGYRTNTVDLDQYITGLPTSAIVRETIVQGFTPANELVFQWRAWDNYDIRDQNGNSDFPHLNGLDIDQDGNILVSARHLSEVTKVNRDSGEIMWRLGGAHSTFHFVNDPLNGISFQHNISALGNGHYLVFDNGNARTPQVSRAVEYQLDTTNLTATMVWQFRDNPDKYAFWLGSAQRLTSGNTLINFVRPEYPKAIEADTNGAKTFELSLAPSADSYRAFRFPWTGRLTAPYLVVEPQVDNVTLLFNKFGDTNVAFYRIYGGPAPHPTALLAQSPTSLKKLTDLPNGLFFFRVTSVSTEGIESPFSNEESVQVNIIPAGQNLVQNGAFAQGTNSWSFALKDAASAAWMVENGTSHFYITNSGVGLASIQLLQAGIGLVTGEQYVLDFDAWSDETRYVQAQVVENGGASIDYSGLPATFLTPNPTHYRYKFIMQHPNDFAASLVFNLGSSTAAVYLDNIYLFTPPAGDFNLDKQVSIQDLAIFCADWLTQQHSSPADLDADGTVDFNDFSLFGQSWNFAPP